MKTWQGCSDNLYKICTNISKIVFYFCVSVNFSVNFWWAEKKSFWLFIKDNAQFRNQIKVLQDKNITQWDQSKKWWSRLSEQTNILVSSKLHTEHRTIFRKICCPWRKGKAAVAATTLVCWCVHPQPPNYSQMCPPSGLSWDGFETMSFFSSFLFFWKTTLYLF